jgi:hypothetical protein
MLQKIFWLVALLVVALVVHAGLQRVAAGMLEDAGARVERRDYDGARQKLDSLERWLGWTDAGDGASELRQAIRARIAEEESREEEARERQEFERFTTEWRTMDPIEGPESGDGDGGRSDGVYHGLNRAESLRQKQAD